MPIKLALFEINSGTEYFKIPRSFETYGSFSFSEWRPFPVTIISLLIFSENVNKLIVVTGKGLHSNNEKDPYVSKDLGILKYSVPEFITNNLGLMNKINEIKDAKIEDGGEGAFYIYLKKVK